MDQIQYEFELAKLASTRSSEIKAHLDTVTIEFEIEIKQLAVHIERWRKIDRASREVERKAYKELLNAVPPRKLAENVIRALFESYLVVDIGAPMTYQIVVNNQLIQRRLKAILPIEERVIPVQFKFATVDLLVARTVKYLPQLFIDKQSKDLRQSDWIELTDAAKERLGKVSIDDLLTDIPMFCKPEPWTSVFHGGFMTPEMQRSNPLIGSRHHDFRELSAIDKSLQANGEVLEAVNKMQNVMFKVDPKFAEYQKIIDTVRRNKIIEVQGKIDQLENAIQELEKQQKLEYS